MHIEVDSSLSPTEFLERVIVPLGVVLEREQLGRVLKGDTEEEGCVEGRYELALEVTDLERAKEVVEAVLNSVDG